MNLQKEILKLEVAYDLIASVHSNVCNAATRGNDGISGHTLEILRTLLLVQKKLKGGVQE